MDIILSLVFAAPLLVIMIYPAMKISKFLGNYFNIGENLYNKLTVILTIILSVIAGLFLHFI
jgi:uncharacterized membrane protein